MREGDSYPRGGGDIGRRTAGGKKQGDFDAAGNTLGSTQLTSLSDRGQDFAEITSLKKQLAEQDTLRSQWKSTKEELESQKRLRTGDAARMAATISLLENELVTVSADIAADRGTLSRERNLWRTLAAAGFIAAVALSVASWQIARHTAEIALRNPAPLLASQEGRQTVNALPADPQAAFTTAVDRLDAVLTTVPGVSPEAALRKVSDKRDGCHFVWEEDSPSLVFGREPVLPNSIAATLADCAKAISRLP